ncbi:multicopy suppressor of BFA (Brefeldin A) [Coemansia guatemalensis]|uniref:Multicopy suppressor of BFA (Brefeldin A) n=1 Tax=Coemansia guatemalensis TaxID=2761395 RepID=A0A9W8LTL7_9FUNG|nr:multicopy suppressor of BFA (Brefeldin A) [Coemansia guatemalensis]
MAPESTTQISSEPRTTVSAGKARPLRPNTEQHKKQLAELDTRIANLRKEQDEVRKGLGESNTRRGPYAEERNKLVASLQEIRTEQNGLRKSRGKVFDRQASLTASIRKKTAELKAQQSKLTYKSIEEIDKEIAKKEKQIESGQLKIVEERRLASEIPSLRRAKKLVEQVAAAQKEIDEETAELAKIDAQLGDTNAQALSDEHERLQNKLDGLRASQDVGQKQRDALLSKRARIMKELDSAWDEKRALQDEHRKMNNAFYHWQQEERKLKAQKEKEERVLRQREERLAVAQERREEAEEPAFQDEINSCNTLIAYLRGLVPSTASGGKSEGSKSEESTRPSSAASSTRETDSSEHVPAGMVAVKKTGGEESYFAGTSDRSKKKHYQRKDCRASGTKADVLRLPLAVAERFLELRVDIPTNTMGIAAALKNLAARKQHFIDQQPRATEEKKKKAEEEIAKLMSELNADEKITA